MKKSILLTVMLGMGTALFAQQMPDAEIKRSMQWLEDLETLVKLDTQREDSLSGKDLNANGVRDDVEAYVEEKFHDDPFQEALFMEAAQKIQQIITLPEESSVDEHLKLDKELLSLYTCRDYILYRDNEENIDQQMLNKTLFKARVLNTEERLSAYIEHKKKLPLHFSDLSDDALVQEKNACLARYRSFKDSDTHAAANIVR
ncbi:MAG TPA: hypothetical protein ENK93_04640 [Campylobacteraceae bacterium]|nr:hypothetical protein [Campylobacteraceae bacterium]HHD84145.1 hypothetical protein [Campylobacteraceae bacterium]